MISILYEVLLMISILVLIYMAGKNYENIDIRYWTIVVLVPMILLGYWLKTKVTSPDAAKVTFAYIYLDSTVLLTVILFAILYFMKIRVKAWLKVVAYGAAFGHMVVIWNGIDNESYYKSITLIDTGIGIATKMESGPLKSIHWVYLAIIFLAIVSILVLGWIRRGTFSRKTLIVYSVLLSAGLILYGVESLADVDFSMLPVLYVIADLAIAFSYDHDHAHDITSIVSKQKEEDTRLGYVAIDLKGQYLSCNEKIYDFFPEMQMQIVDNKLKEGTNVAKVLYGLLDDYKERNIDQKNFKLGEMDCQCEVSEFTINKNGKILGYLFDVRDITEEQHVLQVMQDYTDTLNEEVAQKTENIKNIQETVVVGLANMIDNRDNNTGGHVKRTSDIIRILVEEIRKQGLYQLDDQQAEDIIRAAPMHDLGKITIENSILNKPGKLTDEEYAIMKTHSAKSGEFVHIILDDVEEEHFVQVAFNVARYHHERWDGRGYPDRLVGEMIPVEARIMAVADVYDALISDRCYRKAMPPQQVTEIMIESMGSQFDPNMYPIFLGCKDRLEAYYRSEK